MPVAHYAPSGIFTFAVEAGTQVGLEPTTFGTTNRRSNRVSYKVHITKQKHRFDSPKASKGAEAQGFEPRERSHVRQFSRLL
jgi:hypothetical protein